jgi:hypothetical protein
MMMVLLLLMVTMTVTPAGQVWNGSTGVLLMDLQGYLISASAVALWRGHSLPGGPHRFAAKDQPSSVKVKGGGGVGMLMKKEG